MNLLEIKNNLAKLSYMEEENPVLGRFVVFVSPERSYVAQIVNLKSDAANNYAIARLIFNFNSEGIVENYDGSIPSMSSEIGNLPASELLNLLPIETPLKIGNLAQSDDMLAVDVSVFEHNLTVFSENDQNKKNFISNCVRQLFQMKEKSVIIDNSNIFEDYPKIVPGVDFKMPLNSSMLDYIFEHELAGVNVETKAVIQDIFYAVQKYVESLEFKFIPIDNLVDVVTNQYKETQMPELALLKNRLLKYRDANLLANTKDEVVALENRLKEKNCCIIDVKDLSESLQNELISQVHSIIENFDKYVYFFVPVTDGNSDKKLLKKFVNHNHVFTTVLASNEYKYANELKQHAQNMIIFTPATLTNDLAAYSTFLGKLGPNECVVCGRLTHDIPFITEVGMLETDLTQDDVLGDRYQFIPANEDLQMVKVDDFGNKIPIKLQHGSIAHFDSQIGEKQTSEMQIEAPAVVKTEIEEIEQYGDEQIIDEVPTEEPEVSEETEYPVPEEVEESPVEESNIINPVSNILEDDSEDYEQEHETEYQEEYQEDTSYAQEVSEYPPEVVQKLQEVPETQEIPDAKDFAEEQEYVDPQEFTDSQELEATPELPETQDIAEALDETTLTDSDLDMLEATNQYEPEQEDEVEYVDESEFSDDDTPVVPIYPADDENAASEADDEIENFDFAQGDTVEHKKYGRGVIEKIIKYGNKTLCSITFENNIGRRLLDPTITDIVKI